MDCFFVCEGYFSLSHFGKTPNLFLMLRLVISWIPILSTKVKYIQLLNITLNYVGYAFINIVLFQLLITLFLDDHRS